MNRQPPLALGQKLALIALALVACLRPVWGGQVAIGSSTHGRTVDARSCCVQPEPASCCPKNEGRQSAPVFVPKCCAYDAPPSDPRQSESLPKLGVPDPTKRVLRELTRALHQVALLAPGTLGHFGIANDGAGLSPPDSVRDARSPALHWVTDRELLAALAMLSIARL